MKLMTTRLLETGIATLSALLFSSLLATLFSPAVTAAGGEVSISHYFTGELGLKAFNSQVDKFTRESGIKIVDSPVGHEDFKTDILVRAAGRSLPDVFSYWAGARTQFVADAGALHAIDAMWTRNGLDKVVVRSIADSATIYNGKRYLVPFNYHYAGMFYNTKIMEEAGISSFPTDWDGFVKLCANLKSKGITPLVLGSKNRWPAQFWFDYLLLRTAGPEYRDKLMSGDASYTDQEVKNALLLWKELMDAGYFSENANADDWTDASDKVARGEVAMTLMGTWITGYWNGLGLTPGKDYNVFEFPKVNSGVANAVVGPVDGLVISTTARNTAGAEAFLSFMISNEDVQAAWADAQGALSANVNIDTSTYNVVIQKAAAAVKAAETFAFNYDLATPPPVAEVGLSMFTRFIDDPSQMDAMLEQVADDAAEAFKL